MNANGEQNGPRMNANKRESGAQRLSAFNGVSTSLRQSCCEGLCGAVPLDRAGRPRPATIEPARGPCREGAQGEGARRTRHSSRPLHESSRYPSALIRVHSRLKAFALLFATTAYATTFSYHVAGDDAGPWPAILSSIGLRADAPGLAAAAHAGIFVVRDPALAPAEWLQRAQAGAILIVEGDTPLARELGFRPTPRRIVVRNVLDWRQPDLAIYWQRPLALPVFDVPRPAVVFAEDRWEHAPLMAGLRLGKGAALWLAVTPGERGHERFPYLLQALADLGLAPGLRGNGLWAFFDSSYRLRADLDYLAERWQRAGIAALHTAAWHYFEPDPQRDAYLRSLIAACHRRAILVYAWLELPHVSDRFWNDHPEWREKTAILQDAQLDWRRLMNLANRDCFREAARGVRSLLERFDWDGVNLAELYFESLEGTSNPARFTPMNDDIRREFRERHGYDPTTLFAGPADPARMAPFLNFRAGLASRLQSEWIAEIEALRRRRGDLDLVLTHVDDRIDPKMRDAIGADSSAVLPLLSRHDFTFLVEDPATVWDQGPERYAHIAAAYRKAAPRPERLAIDINIAERYQDVYPTRQQTGVELFQLVQTAARAFPRVALYFENSLLPPDLPLLPASAAVPDRIEQAGRRLLVQSARGMGIRWKGPATVNGRIWPVQDGETLWLPPGAFGIEPAESAPPLRLVHFSGALRTAAASQGGIEFSYESPARAFAVFDRPIKRLELDGAPSALDLRPEGAVSLPRGQHLARVWP